MQDSVSLPGRQLVVSAEPGVFPRPAITFDLFSCSICLGTCLIVFFIWVPFYGLVWPITLLHSCDSTLSNLSYSELLRPVCRSVCWSVCRFDRCRKRRLMKVHFNLRLWSTELRFDDQHFWSFEEFGEFLLCFNLPLILLRNQIQMDRPIWPL